MFRKFYFTSDLRVGSFGISYLISVESFLAETGWHVFRLSLLLSLVLEKQILPLGEDKDDLKQTKQKAAPITQHVRLRIGWYLIGFHERLVELRLRSRSHVAIEEWVCAMTPHGRGIPVLYNPGPSSDPTA